MLASGFLIARRSIASLAVLLAAALPASAQTPLAWSLKKGETLKYDFIQKNDIKVTVNGQDVSNKTELDVDLTWKVDDVKDGVATIAQTIDHAKVTLNLPTQEIVYDSKVKKGDDPGVQQIAKIYDNVIGEKYTLKIDKFGQISDVKVPEKVSTAIKGSPFEAMADSGSLLSAKGIEKMMAQVLPKLSDKPIEKGKTWTGTLELPAGPLSMKLDTTYTLTDSTPAKATIDGKIDTKITTPENSPIQVKVNKQTGESHYELDTTAGHLASSSIKQEFDMTLNANNQEIAQTITINASMKLIK